MSRARGFDAAVLDAFIVAPAVVSLGWLLLLSGGFDERAMAVVWLLAALALRPLVWRWASSRQGTPERRAGAYHERERYAANTSFAAAAVMGLGALDVFRLPGGPYWQHQPGGWMALSFVALYLVWLSSRTDIPREVSAGWGGLLQRTRQEGA